MTRLIEMIDTIHASSAAVLPQEQAAELQPRIVSPVAAEVRHHVRVRGLVQAARFRGDSEIFPGLVSYTLNVAKVPAA